MNYMDNKLLFELYDELDRVLLEQNELRRFRKVPEGYTLEEALQELEEEEYYIKMKIEELSIVQSDYNNEEF